MEKKELLIEDNSNQNNERSDSFIRRSTFIPTPETENDDSRLLKEMGFDDFYGFDSFLKESVSCS